MLFKKQQAVLLIFIFITSVSFAQSQVNFTNDGIEKIELQSIQSIIRVYNDVIIARTEIKLNNQSSKEVWLNFNEGPFKFFDFQDSVEITMNGSSNISDVEHVYIGKGENFLTKIEGYKLKNFSIEFSMNELKQFEGRINSGQIFIQLMDNLKIQNITDLLPENVFITDGNNLLLRKFENLEPDTLTNVRFNFLPLNDSSANNTQNWNLLFDSIKREDTRLLSINTKYRNSNPYETTPERSIGIVVLFIMGTAFTMFLLAWIGVKSYQFYLRKTNQSKKV